MANRPTRAAVTAYMTLFNVKEDIAEKRNLYGEYSEVVRELSRLLAQAKSDGRAAAISQDGDVHLAE